MTELILTISDSNDDADQNAATTVTLTRTAFTHDVTGEWLGLRFQSATIPQGATIDSAICAVYIIGTTSDDPGGTWYANDVDSAAAISASANNLSSRTLTTASVAWSATNVTSGADAFANSPDLKTIIQELVDRAGWASGNNLLLLFASDGTGGMRVGYRDGSVSWAATLTINYTVAGGAVQKAHHIADGVTHYSKFSRIHH